MRLLNDKNIYADGSAYTSRTAEGGLLEAAMFVQALEGNDFTNPTKQNKVNVSINTDALVATITASIPIKIQRNSLGETNITAWEYLATIGDNPMTAPPDIVPKTSTTQST